MPVFRGLVPKKIKPRVDFDMSSFRQKVYEKGLRIKWEQSAECPCQTVISVGTGTNMYNQARTSGTREPQSNCAGCGGSGVLYTFQQEIRALVIGAQQDYDRFRLYGEYAKGMVGITTLPEHMPGVLDRFTLLDNYMTFKETVVKASAATQPLRYPIASKSVVVGTEADLTNSETITVDVLHIAKADVNGTYSSQVYTKGVHFTVVDGKVDWTLGTALGVAPTEGEYFAVTYVANPRYAVMNHPHAFRDTYILRKTADPVLTQMPIKVDCMLDFLTDR